MVVPRFGRWFQRVREPDTIIINGAYCTVALYDSLDRKISERDVPLRDEGNGIYTIDWGRTPDIADTYRLFVYNMRGIT